jgi:hypothetical protein
MVGVGKVGDPFPILGECEVGGGNAGEKRQELLRFHVIANDFSSLFRADCEELFSIAAPACPTLVGKLSVREPNGFSRTVKKLCLHRKQPKIPATLMPGGVDQVFPIGTPGAATL